MGAFFWVVYEGCRRKGKRSEEGETDTGNMESWKLSSERKKTKKTGGKKEGAE